MNNKKNLIKKIKHKKAVVAIIGLGYVGLPLALECCKKGFKTIGFDIDKNKIEKINLGISYIKQVKNINLPKKKKLYATDNFSIIKNCDLIILCVPTPLSKNLNPDLSYLKKTIKSISPFINSKKLISLESTSYPGTTYEELVSKFKLKFNIGKNLFICYSPEREDPGNKQYKTIDVPKVISGHTKNCLEVGKVFYSSIFKKLEPVSSTGTAEFTKLLENIYRSVNIGLVNEMKIIADLMKLDIYEIIKAASTKPFGFKAFYPGPGTGGHCIPIDPFYMSWKSRKFGYDPKFIKSSGIINTKISTWIVNKVVKVLKIKKINLIKSKILIIGVAYKKNVDDIRESPAFPIIKKLQMKKIKISYHDPYVPELHKSRHYNFKLKSIKLSEKNIKKFSAVIIVTDHDNIKYSLIEKNSKIIFDSRGRFLPKNNYSKSKIYTV